jgi:hypothetical protein
MNCLVYETIVVREIMKVRRTISIEKGDLETLKPFLDSNGNNLSLALRQLIDHYRQEKNMKTMTSDRQKIIMLRNQVIENRIAALIPIPLIKWLVKCNLGVPPLGTFRIIMEKYTKLIGMNGISLNDYVMMVNIHGDIFGYQIRQHIETSPDSRNIRISFEGEDPDHLRGAVVDYSCMLAHHPLKLKTKKVVESPNLIIIDYEQCTSEEEAYRSVIDHFGSNQSILDEVQKNIQFWRNIVNILKADNYEDIIMSREIFLQLLKSRDFSEQLINLISTIYGVSIEEADYRDMIRLVEEVCKTNGLINRIECHDNKIQIYHKFNDKDIIRVVNDTIIKTLEISGQHFVLKKGDKMTVFSIRN